MDDTKPALMVLGHIQTHFATPYALAAAARDVPVLGAIGSRDQPTTNGRWPREFGASWCRAGPWPAKSCAITGCHGRRSTWSAGCRWTTTYSAVSRPPAKRRWPALRREEVPAR
jgi:hypothetical protein